MTIICYFCSRPITGKICEAPLPWVGVAYCCAECAKGAKYDY